jgi:ABC-type transporter Mla subunit MlaD
VVRVLNQLDPDAIGRIINESDAALPDPNVVLPNLSRASALFNNLVNDQHGQGRVLLGNFQTLIRNAEWVNPDLLAIVPNAIETGIYWQDFFKQLPMVFSRDMPQGMRNLNNLVARIQGLLDTNGGDLKVLGEALQPKLNEIGAVLMNFDSGQILDNFLQQVPDGGTITLRVRP